MEMQKNRRPMSTNNPAYGLKTAAKLEWEKKQKAQKAAFIATLKKESK